MIKEIRKHLKLIKIVKHSPELARSFEFDLWEMALEIISDDNF